MVPYPDRLMWINDNNDLEIIHMFSPADAASDDSNIIIESTCNYPSGGNIRGVFYARHDERIPHDTAAYDDAAG
jgi:hypothetical protein